MIGPEKLLDLVVELTVVVLAVAGVDDAVVAGPVTKTHEADDVVDGVAIGLL